MPISSYNFRRVEKNFLKELQDASSGKKTSLPYIIHQIPSSPLIVDNEIFAVFVIGGTVFKKALVKKINGKIKILKEEQKNIMPFKTKKEFFEFIEKELDHNVKNIALNFAYPLTPVFLEGRLDGILISGSKENTFTGLSGQMVGKEIEQYILKKQNKKIIVSLANDTVCLLLSGLTSYKWNNLAAGIVGTGTNFAFFLDKNRLVNLESANFNKFLQSNEGKAIDSLSIFPGKALFEKEVSGAYLYKHFNFLIETNKLQIKPIDSTEMLSKLAKKNSEDGKLAKKLLLKSAGLIAKQIVGITMLKKQNMAFVMEGSLFWEGYMYKDHIEKLVKKDLPEYKIKFMQLKTSPILGAAKLIC